MVIVYHAANIDGWLSERGSSWDDAILEVVREPIDSSAGAGVRPGFTVVIPVFNGPSVVRDAIDSALVGAGPHDEVVVVDDGSTDATVAILGAIDDPRVRVVTTAHGGVSSARNIGAREARAPTVVFLDADDVLLPGWQQAVATAHLQDAQVVCWPVLWREPTRTHRGEMPAVTPWAIKGFLAGAFSMTKQVFEEVGEYDPVLGYAESTELSIRLREWLRERPEALVILDDAWCSRRGNASPAHRDLAYAERRLVATEHIFARHGRGLLQGSHLLALYLTIGGVAAARLRHWTDARRLFASALRSGRPTVRGTSRLLASCLPGLRRLVWPVARDPV